MIIETPQQWATAQFGQANLNDPRRTQRLVKLAASIVQQPGVAVSQLPLSPADMEGAYRFIRNDQVSAAAIADAGFQATVAQAEQHELLLSIEDTTTLSFSHRSVFEALGHTNQNNSSRAFQVHSALLFAPHCEQVVGLIAQQRWTREVSARGQRHQHATRPYEEKESYKWERASRDIASRLGEQMGKVISVCDREADIYEYLSYKQAQQQRFIVRSMQSRCIEEHDNKLYDYAEKLHSAGSKTLSVPQKGGRQASVVALDIKYAKVTLKAPANKTSQPDIPLYYVGCIERDTGGADDRSRERLAWHLLTSETIDSDAMARQIVAHYERRWLIEDYHKVWKSAGTDVEELRMQSKDNLERMSVILAFIATRLLQLRFIQATEEAKTQPCTHILGNKAWKLLWLKVNSKVLPSSPPDMVWAYRSLAKLGGWKDTKRTGRASVKALWQGWFRLQTILEGYELALSLEQGDL